MSGEIAGPAVIFVAESLPEVDFDSDHTGLSTIQRALGV